MKLVPMLLVLVLFSGCSNRGIYQGFQTSKQMECSTLPRSEYQECMENARKPYDEYERERKKALGQ